MEEEKERRSGVEGRRGKVDVTERGKERGKGRREVERGGSECPLSSLHLFRL